MTYIYMVYIRNACIHGNIINFMSYTIVSFIVLTIDVIELFEVYYTFYFEDIAVVIFIIFLIRCHLQYCFTSTGNISIKHKMFKQPWNSFHIHNQLLIIYVIIECIFIFCHSGGRQVLFQLCYIIKYDYCYCEHYKQFCIELKSFI